MIGVIKEEGNLKVCIGMIKTYDKKVCIGMIKTDYKV